MEIFAFILHLLLDFLLGIGILSLLKKENLPFAHFFIAILLGLISETMTSFILMWMGASLHIAFFLNVLVAIALNARKMATSLKSPKSIVEKLKKQGTKYLSLKWYEHIFLVLIFQKIAVIIWQLYRIPTFHYDATKHWSTQARAIYSEINFSMVPNTLDFLGEELRVVNGYPLEIPIWRANSAIINNGWSEFVSRSDGLLFFMAICGIVSSVVWMLTKKRWMALGAAFIIASLPLQVWHGAAGYADIAVEALLVAAIACLIGKEWLLCGIFTAGVIWTKNDGLAMYFPAILAAVLTFHLSQKQFSFSKRIKTASSFFAGLAVITPWLIFQSLFSYTIFNKMLKPFKNLLTSTSSSPNDYQVILTQSKEELENAPSPLQLFWDYVFVGPTFGIFWIMIFLGLIIVSRKLISDAVGRSLLVFFIVSSIIIIYIFSFTDAYKFLLLQTTIHRVLLQFSAAALLVLSYGISLQMKSNES